MDLNDISYSLAMIIPSTANSFRSNSKMESISLTSESIILGKLLSDTQSDPNSLAKMAIPSDRQAQQQQPPQQSAQHEIVEWYKSVPPVTRFLLTSVVAVSALGNFRLIPPGFFALIYQPAIKELQIWRLMTCFFYGKFGFPFLWTVYFLYNHSRGLESGHFAGRTGDYAWCLFLIMSTLVVSSLPFQHLMSSCLVSCLVVSS